MKLKYYLRGIGIGILVTTLIFMIVISIRKNDSGPQDGFVPETESKTVAQVNKERQEDTQTALVDTETETAPPLETETQQTQPFEGAGLDFQDMPDETEADEPETGEAAPDEPHVEPKPQEKIRVEISGGQYSDVVCKKLEEAGLVDNAKAFNDFLVQKDYDNSILPGVYEIPKGATYEEIAVLLTTKVE